MAGAARWILLGGSKTLLFGHQAVLVFFILSGFCIHLRQAKILKASDAANRGHGRLPLDLPRYAWRRLRRLAPPLLVAVGLTVVLDQVGSAMNPGFYAAQGPIESINTYLFGVGDRSLGTLVGNLAFQGSLIVPTFGTDSPLWSLSYEFWYYAMYPIALIAAVRFGPRGMLSLAAAASGIALVVLLHDPAAQLAWAGQVTSYWVVWTAGAFIAEAYTGRVRIPFLRLLGPIAGLAAVAVLGALALNTLHPRFSIDQQIEDLLWSGALSIIFAWAMLGTPAAVIPWIERAARRVSPLGHMSYSLYVVHMPVLALLSGWWLTTHTALPTGIELATVGVVCALGLAAACWFFVERHCVSDQRKRDQVAYAHAPSTAAAELTAA
jgi:peptidoglycan/LPS O-acetylase OafA/YrhL